MSIDLQWLQKNLELKAVDEGDLRELLCLEELVFGVGDTILKQFGEGGGMYILHAGHISILSHKENETVVLARDGEGALFAKDCLLDAHCKSNVEVVADGNCSVYRLTHASFLKIMRTHHKLAYAILFHMLNYQAAMIQKKEHQLFPFLLSLRRKAERLPLPVKLVPVLFVVLYTSAFFFKLL